MTHLQQQGDLVRPGSLETFSKQETSESFKLTTGEAYYNVHGNMGILRPMIV